MTKKTRLISSSLVIGLLVLAPLQSAYSQEKVITILGTNDLHGAIEPETTKAGNQIGGFAFWVGAIRSIKTGLAKKYGANAGVLVVDAGDQFQGTLLSNYYEGQLMFALMNQAGYDAITPGNHDYDFGPVGWLKDKATPGTNEDPRGALKKLVSQAKFPLLSANTYLKASLGNSVQSNLCASTTPINWAVARRPEFLKPYLIKEVAGVRVALVGIDNPFTASTTTPENVSDLCFRAPLDAYLEVRAALEGQADLFVMVIHDGAKELEPIVRKIVAAGPNQLHAIYAGHTHRREYLNIQGVPVIQSGANGEAFGRMDLVWNTETKALDLKKSSARYALNLSHGQCAVGTENFCQTVLMGGIPRVTYDGELVLEDTATLQLIAKARTAIAGLAQRKLGNAKAPVSRDRILESPMSNLIADGLRTVSGADIALINTGGVRAGLSAGLVTYEDFFRVLPFNNRGVLVGPMKRKTIIALLQRSAETCGSYGSLMQSGLLVEYERQCKDGTTDPKAKLLNVRTLDGRVIAIDDATDNTEFRVATFDFLVAGGSGFEFERPPVLRDLGIVRELLVTDYFKSGYEFSAQVDGRWKLVPPSARR